MKLRDRKFEKALRRRVRREVRASHAAWLEFRRVRRPWWRRETNIPPWLLRFLLPLFLVAFWSASRHRLDELVVVALFISFASVAVRAGQLMVALRTSPRLFIYAHLPLSDEQIFRLQWQYFLRTSAWSILDFTAFYGMMADREGYGGNSWIAGVGMAVAQWLVILSAAACSLAYVRNRRIFRLTGLSVLAAVALFFFPSLISVTKPLAGLAAWIPPTGWILYSMGISPPRNLLCEWWTALSFAAALFLLPLAYRRLCRTFAMPQWTVANAAALGAVEAWRRSEADGSKPDAFAGITAAIRRREFLKEFDWERAGWVERLAAAWLKPRERTALEFLSGGNPRWTRGLTRFGLILGGCVVLLGIFPELFAAMAPFFGLFIPIVAIFLISRQAMQAGWPGAVLRTVSGSNISICSAYPVGFRQIARVTIAANVARVAILAPFLAVAACPFLKNWNLSPGAAGMWGAKILAAIVALELLTPIVLITGGTNDGSRWRMVLLTIAWAGVAIASGVFFFFARTWVVLVAASCLMIGVCFAALAIYGHAYDHNWFDLQSKPKETLGARRQ